MTHVQLLESDAILHSLGSSQPPEGSGFPADPKDESMSYAGQNASLLVGVEQPYMENGVWFSGKHSQPLDHPLGTGGVCSVGWSAVPVT